MNHILNKFDVETSLISSLKINLNDCRFDPSFFSSNQNFINGLKTQSIEELCERVFNPLVFKREFISDPSESRYLASAEIASLEPDITYITNDQAEKLNLKVKKGWILVTGFGTIGSIRIVDEIINGYAVANNVARIIPKEGLLGFLAAFLESTYGNKLLNDYSAGAVVKYIEAPQISKIPIPILSEEVIKGTNECYLKAVKCREEAYKNLVKARQLVQQYNNLPELSISNIETIDPQKEIEIRSVSTAEFQIDYRLDAHFYNPFAKKAIDNIKNYSESFKLLNELTDSIFMCDRFNRNYVEKEFGLPFLSGKNIIQIKPDLKYISKSETNEIEELRLGKEWTLITRSGTLGRVGYVWDNYEDYTATEDIVRVVSNETIDSGYLNAFLSTGYGYHQILRFKHGAVIDHFTPEDLGYVIIPLCNQQKEIGDLVRRCYDLRAEAIHLEDESQELLSKALNEL